MTRQPEHFKDILRVIFGQPDTLEADIETVKRLLPNRLEDQFFRTEDAINCL